MELVASQTQGAKDLGQWAMMRVGDRSPASDDQRVDLLRDVAAGMLFLHDRGYIHADLKPGNVRPARARGGT